MASKSVYWQGAFFMTGIALLLMAHSPNLEFWNRVEIVVLAIPFLQTWRTRTNQESGSTVALLIIVWIFHDRYQSLRTTQITCTIEFFSILLVFAVCNSKRFRPDPLQTFWGRLENRIESGVPIFPEGLPQWFRWKWYRLRMGRSYYQ